MAEHRFWFETYRPLSFDDYVWMDDRIKAMVLEWVSHGTLPSMILTGGPGCGKTSLAELLLHQLKIDDGDVLRLNGPRDNNVETVRTKVQEFCELGGWSGLRVIVINEADVLSFGAQQLLRNMMDEHVDTVRWIFTCNYPHRIIEPISSSRLIRIDIDKLDLDRFTERMCKILLAENIDIDDKNYLVVEQIRNSCYPDLRKAINVMQHSVRGGVLTAMHEIKAVSGVWETYLRNLFLKPHDALRELGTIRDMLKTLTPEEMEEVYRFLYHNGTELFGAKQINAIIIINNGQKSHRAALLPDMILLEAILRLMALVKPTNE